MSFFPKSFFAEKPKRGNSQELPKKSRQIPTPKPKGGHFHVCQSCTFRYRCGFDNCTEPDSVMACYVCKGSNFRLAKTV